MKRTILLLIGFLIISTLTFSQDIAKSAKAKDESGIATVDTLKDWRIKSTGGLNFSQAAFSNWAAGGDNSIGLDVYLNLQANYRHGKHAWANSVNVGYGLQYLGAGNDAQFRKTNDKLELTTAYGYEIHKNKKWFFTVLANFRSQFASGYNYPDDSTIISKFMAPGYLIAGVGITYTPAKWIMMYLSPASVRMTFVLDDSLSNAGAYGVDPGNQLKTEFGPYFRAEINKDLAKNINLATSLELYTDYLKEFGNIDVNWNLMVTMKVNKWLAASINTQLIYDDNIKFGKTETEPGSPRTQFKEILGIGITYMFDNMKSK